VTLPHEVAPSTWHRLCGTVLPASTSTPSKVLSSPIAPSCSPRCKMTLVSTRAVAVQLHVAFGVLRGSVLVWADAPQQLPAALLVRSSALWHWCGVSDAALDAGHGDKVPALGMLTPGSSQGPAPGSSRRLLETHGSQGGL